MGNVSSPVRTRPKAPKVSSDYREAQSGAILTRLRDLEGTVGKLEARIVKLEGEKKTIMLTTSPKINEKGK